MNKHYGKQGIRFLQLQFEIGDTYNSKRNEWKKGIFYSPFYNNNKNTFAKLQKSSLT